MQHDIDKYESQIEELNKLILIHPDSEKHYCIRGNIKRDNKYFNDAIIDYNKALDLNSKFAQAYFERAICKVRACDFKSALEDYSFGIKLNPSSAAYFNRGLSKLKLNQNLEAIEDLDRSIAMNLNFSLAYSTRAFVRSKLKNFPEAVSDLNLAFFYSDDEKKVQISKQLLNTYMEWGLSEFNESNYSRANELFEFCVKNQFVLSESRAIVYLTNKLLLIDPKTELSSNNSTYERLQGLRDEYNMKVERNYWGVIEPMPFTQSELNVVKLIQYQGEYKIGFGKYNGESINNIIEINPDFILFCIIFLEHFSVSNYLLMNRNLSCSKMYLKAIEINLIKTILIEKWKNEADEESYLKELERREIDAERSDRENFYAMTDGQLGDFDDYNGDIDDVMTWAGRD